MKENKTSLKITTEMTGSLEDYHEMLELKLAQLARAGYQLGELALVSGFVNPSVKEKALAYLCIEIDDGVVAEHAIVTSRDLKRGFSGSNDSEP